MKDSDIRTLDMGKRAREFTLLHKSDFADGSYGAKLIDDLNKAIEETEKQGGAQDAAALDRQESTEQKDAAIKTLLEQVRAINRTARAINNLFPGIADQFRMPSNSDQSVLNRARAFLSEAAPIQTEFTKRDLPASFLADLQGAVDAVEAAEERQSAALARQTEATAAVTLALKTLRDIVRELDVVIRNKYSTEPDILASWRSASHIESAPKKAKKPAPPSS